MALDQVDVDKSEGKVEMSFFDHLEELRWHLLRSVVVVFVLMIVIFTAKDFVFNDIIFAPRHTDFITYKWMCKLAKVTHMDGLCITPVQFNVNAIELGEAFFTHMQVSFVLGLIVGFPYIFWEFWRFIAPGLYPNERKSARGMVLICSLLFLTGILFGYYIIAPFAISFLAGYTIPGTTSMPTISSYMGYMVMFTLPIGLVFELPVVIFFLTKIGLVGPAFLRTYRKHMFLIILVVAGIITPSPDIVSQLLVGIPLYILFEVSIIVSQNVEKNKLKELEDI
jgi:sec-independent protein translocase protein TatC